MTDLAHHQPLIAPHRDGWGVYCEACSADAGHYVFPCKVRDDDVFPTTEVLVDRDRLLTDLADELRSFRVDDTSNERAKGFNGAITVAVHTVQSKRSGGEQG